MKSRLRKNVYFVGSDKKGVSLMVPERAHAALAALARDNNTSIPGVIYDILEMYLVEEGLEGGVEWPEGVNKEKYTD